MNKTKEIVDNPTRIGRVSINSKNIETLKEFYTKGILLKILSESSKNTHIGKDKTLLALYDSKSLPLPKKDDAGLYHIAILYTSRGELANVIKNMLDKYPQNYSGSADHEVSEAFYFNDPEGNGIELYADKPRTEWKWEGNKVRMGTKRLDVNEFIEKHDDGARNGAVSIGHIHLKIGNIAEAKKFYVDILGFEITSERNGALFVSRNGYHHNIGLNIWESEGAKIRKETIGLESYEIITPQENEIISSLDKEKIKYTIEHKKINLQDPWGNKIIITEE